MTPRARRLHPAAVGAEALDALRQLALPILVVAVLGGGFSAQGGARALLFGAFGVIASVGLAWVQWVSTRWYLGDEEVRLRRGVLSESVVTIPLERVQAVDTVRGPVQRLFGVVQLDVQSAGGGRRGEIVLKAVTEEEAEELRAAVRAAGAGADDTAMRVVPGIQGQPASERPQASWRLGRRGLLLAALTSGSLGVLVPVVAAATQVLDDLVGAEAAQGLLPGSVGEAAVLGAAVLALAWVLSMLGTVVAFAGFAVTRDGERVRIRRGIVERRDASVPVARIHAVRVIETPLREPFGLAQVRVETAGYAQEPATAQTLLPLVRRTEVEAVLAELLPELGVRLGALEPLPRRALRRYVLPPVALAAAVAAAAVIVLGPAGAAAAALLVPAALLGGARFRAGGWRLADGRLVLRSRRLNRTTALADARRLQAVATSVTPLQRRGRLATLHADVSSGRTLALAHLDGPTASELFGRLGRLSVHHDAV